MPRLVLLVLALVLVGCDSQRHHVSTDWATVVGPTPSTLVEVKHGPDEALRAIFTDEMTADSVVVTITPEAGFSFDAEALDINRSAVLEQIESELVQTLEQIKALR